MLTILQVDYHDLNFVLYLLYWLQKNYTTIWLLNHNFFGIVTLIFFTENFFCFNFQ